MRTVTTVFLCSTAKDLQPYRGAVFQAILKGGRGTLNSRNGLLLASKFS